MAAINDEYNIYLTLPYIQNRAQKQQQEAHAFFLAPITIELSIKCIN